MCGPAGVTRMYTRLPSTTRVRSAGVAVAAGPASRVECRAAAYRARVECRAAAYRDHLEGSSMLSRIAEALFWIGRYIERSDGTARILDVHLQLLLEDPRSEEHTSELQSLMRISYAVSCLKK